MVVDILPGMCDRAKQLISDMKNKINRLETVLSFNTVELARLEEDLKIDLRKKPTTTGFSHSQTPTTMFVVVFVDVFVAVVMAKYFSI